ncbi:hypothetical protein BDV19DRAFT_391029 [Aspergillus venezuelensis]
MGKNKLQLYVALYLSGVVNNEERKYHWGFVVGPKSENAPEVPGKRYHVKNTPVKGWEYQEVDLADVRTTTTLLARVLVAMIENQERLVSIIRSIPIIQNDPNWRCRTWLANALEAIAKDSKAVGTSELDLRKIEPTARRYVADKTSAGRYESAANLAGPRPNLGYDHEQADCSMNMLQTWPGSRVELLNDHISPH